MNLRSNDNSSVIEAFMTSSDFSLMWPTMAVTLSQPNTSVFILQQRLQALIKGREGKLNLHHLLETLLRLLQPPPLMMPSMRKSLTTSSSFFLPRVHDPVLRQWWQTPRLSLLQTPLQCRLSRQSSLH